MDLTRLGENKPVEDLRVFRRPLSTIAQMHRRIPGAVGMPMLQLVGGEN